MPSYFCQIPISPGRIGQTVEHSKFKSTQPSPHADGTPCIIHVLQIQQNAMEDDMSDSLPPPPPPPPDEHLPPGSPHHQQQMQQMQQQLQQQQHAMTMCTSPRPPPNRQVAIIHNPEIQVRSKVGRVYRRLGTPAKKVRQIRKSQFSFFGYPICRIC